MELDLLDFISDEQVRRDWSDEVNSLHRELAVQESVRVVNSLMNDQRLGVTVDGELRGCLEEVLEQFALGQAIYFAFKASKYLGEKSNLSKVTATHRLNTMTRSIASYARNVVERGWKADTYRLSGYGEQSVMSRLFFNKILRLECKGATVRVPLNRM